MSQNDSLGDRMKRYEAATRQLLPIRTYTVIRVDGRAFHTVLKHAEKPFDLSVVAAMDAAAKLLVQEIPGALVAYTQSDEISVIVQDFATFQTEPWFGGNVQKLASVTASIATLGFTRVWKAYSERPEHFATFDSRVFTIPNRIEVMNYLLWRQQDAVRNSILMVAQALYSHEELQGVNTERLQDMIWEKGINWNDYAPGLKRGRVVFRDTSDTTLQRLHDMVMRTFDITHEAVSAAPRGFWKVQDAPHFIAQPGEWLDDVLTKWDV